MVIAEGHDYAVVIMTVISNQSWMKSEYIIATAYTAPEWLSALDGSNGSDLRHKRSAGTSIDKHILNVYRETSSRSRQEDPAVAEAAGCNEQRMGLFPTSVRFEPNLH